MDSGILAKLMQKKSDQAPMDPDYKNAKMSMLQALKSEMSKSMGDGLRGDSMKKVEVAAPDAASLGKGLDLAKQAVGHSGVEDAFGKDAESSEDPKEEASESPEMEASEGDEGGDLEAMLKTMSPEDKQKLMMLLQAVKGGV